MFPFGDVALATVAALAAALTEMDRAGVLGAGDTNPGGVLLADAARKRHGQMVLFLPGGALRRRRRRLARQEPAAALRLLIGNRALGLLVDRQIHDVLL